jgi:hypothetical protein
MKTIRLILILLWGGYFMYLTYLTRYQTFFFESIIWGGLISIGLLLFIWTIIKDIGLFKLKRQAQSFSLTILILIFLISILSLRSFINRNFNKPTLLRVYYDGDYNGSGIDFKTDGSYIFDNSAIGVSDFYYGTYQINGNRITLDKDTIENLTQLRYLEIQEDSKPDMYLLNISESGILIGTHKFRIIVDNRARG